MKGNIRFSAFLTILITLQTINSFAADFVNLYAGQNVFFKSESEVTNGKIVKKSRSGFLGMSGTFKIDVVSDAGKELNFENTSGNFHEILIKNGCNLNEICVGNEAFVVEETTLSDGATDTVVAVGTVVAVQTSLQVGRSNWFSSAVVEVSRNRALPLKKYYMGATALLDQPIGLRDSGFRTGSEIKFYEDKSKEVRFGTIVGASLNKSNCGSDLIFVKIENSESIISLLENMNRACSNFNTRHIIQSREDEGYLPLMAEAYIDLLSVGREEQYPPGLTSSERSAYNRHFLNTFTKVEVIHSSDRQAVVARFIGRSGSSRPVFDRYLKKVETAKLGLTTGCTQAFMDQSYCIGDSVHDERLGYAGKVVAVFPSGYVDPHYPASQRGEGQLVLLEKPSEVQRNGPVLWAVPTSYLKR